MQMAINWHGPDIGALAAVIVRLEIVVVGPANLPAGYGHVDIAILDWIVSEGRRAAAALFGCDGRTQRVNGRESGSVQG
jgi:hypothetical protein